MLLLDQPSLLLRFGGWRRFSFLVLCDGVAKEFCEPRQGSIAIGKLRTFDLRRDAKDSGAIDAASQPLSDPFLPIVRQGKGGYIDLDRDPSLDLVDILSAGATAARRHGTQQWRRNDEALAEIEVAHHDSLATRT